MPAEQTLCPCEWAVAVFAAAALPLLLHPLAVLRAVVVLRASVGPVLVVTLLSVPRGFVVPRLSESGPC